MFAVMKNNFVVGGLAKSSLIDYPGKISAIIFTQGCNFRCSYCHNPELLSKKEAAFEQEEILNFLKTRVGKLDAVVITGGEPTLQSGLKQFILGVKQLGFLTKLDTNGTNPEILNELINENLLDYIAMDIKAPLRKYHLITQTIQNTDKIQSSIDIIKNSTVDYEFRTTIVKSQLSFEDFQEIGALLDGAKKYYLQKFVPTKLLDMNLKNETTYTDEEFEQITNLLKKNIKTVLVR